MGDNLLMQIAMQAMLGVMMFAMGLGLAVDDFRGVLRDPRAVLIGVLSQIVMLPLLGFGFAFALDLGPEIAIGIVMLAACPGGPSSNLMTNLAEGDTALSVTLSAISGLITVITIPLLLTLSVSTFTQGEFAGQVSFLGTNLRVLLSVGIPIGLGMYLRHQHTARAAKLEPRIKLAAIVLLFVGIIGFAAKNSRTIIDGLADSGPTVIAFNLLTMGLGFGIALLARLPRRQSVTITIEVGMQNAALAIGLGLAILESPAIAAPAIIYGGWMYLSSALVIFAGRKWIRAGQSARS